MIERLDPKDFGELTRLEEFSGNPLLPLPDLPARAKRRVLARGNRGDYLG